VLAQAAGLSRAFQSSANQLAALRSSTDVDLRKTVGEINLLSSQLAEYNRTIQSGVGDDAGLDAMIHTKLEALSELVNISVLQQDDGTFTVLLDGQNPLVIGSAATPLLVETGGSPPAIPPYPLGTPPVTIHDADGRDATALASGGKLGALLRFRNETLASLAGDAEHLGALNQLAISMHDSVNQIVAGGWVQPSQPGASGLFGYDTGNPVAAAATFSVDPAVAEDDLPAIAPGPPMVSNGVPLELAALGDKPIPETGDLSFIEYYGSLAASAGSELQLARDGRDEEGQLLAHARSWRDQVSGVSLDQEAIVLLEFQRAYQATARVVATLNELTADTIAMLR
jgi:flagellar hook-associated protein 1 FlgK